MDTTILHHGALTVTLDSSGAVILRDAGKCPTSDDITLLIPPRGEAAYTNTQEPTLTHTSEEL